MRKLLAVGLVMALGGWACVPMDGGGTPTPTPSASPTPTPTASPTPTPTPPPDGGDADAGKTFYDANCAGCHAADASGNVGPNIQGLDAAEVQAGVEGAAVHAAITISDDDYANLGAYLSTLP